MLDCDTTAAIAGASASRSPQLYVWRRRAWPGAAQSPQERLQLCGTCHGENGNSKMEKMPSLAGQPELFLTNQLILFRERLRKSEVMEPFVKGLTDAEILALAAHYAKLTPEPSPEPVDQALAARGAELARTMHCGSCHLPDYVGREQMPRLARQRIDYTIDSLIAYRAGHALRRRHQHERRHVRRVRPGHPRAREFSRHRSLTGRCREPLRGCL